MQSSQDLRRDGFNMAKLHKSLKQQHQHTLRQRSSSVKLSPAEIRSLNNSVAASKATNMPSPARQRRSSTNTPPLTPDHNAPSRQSTPARNSVSLPTPPQSPDDVAPRRQNSASGNAPYIHSPTPRSNSKAGFVMATNTSRPPSASSHRGMPTYRGPEVTKTGSVSMLHSASRTHHIVDNPLSQFSRPRQSRGSVSPTRQDRRRHSMSESTTYPSRSQSLSAPTPPVNLEERQAPLIATAITTDQHSVASPELMHDDTFEPILDRVQTVAVDGPILSEPRSRFSRGWRRGLAIHRNRDDENDENEKNKRKTLAWARGINQDIRSVAYESTSPGAAPENRTSLKGDLPSSKTSMADHTLEESPLRTNDFDPHPAVRPLSAQSDHGIDLKGKGRERETYEHDENSHDVFSDDTIPMYSRCSCCGKLKKLDGNRPLSPVLENENLKTNISMEIERTDNITSSRRRSNSSSRPKYTPIIPMMLAEGNTVQAKIGPRSYEAFQQQHGPVPLINERGDIIAPGNEPITLIPKQLEEKGRKFVRFSSLHIHDGTAKQAKAEHMDLTITRNGYQKSQEVTDGPSEGVEKHDVSHSEFLDRGTNQNYKPWKKQVVFLPMPEEDTSDLMAAIGGTDAFLGEAKPELELPRSEYGPAISHNKSEVSPASTPQSIEEDHVTISSMEDNITQVLTRSTSDDASMTSRTISFDPNPVEQSRSANNTPPGSIRLKSALKRRPESYQPPPTSNYTNPSSTGFTTRPKATAQFLYRSNSDASQTSMTPSYTKPVNSFSRNVARDGTPHRHSTYIPSTNGGVQPGSIARPTNGAPNSYVEPKTGSSERVSVQESKRTSQDSSRSIGGSIFSRMKGKDTKKSNLVESVLAATSGRHDTGNFMNELKR